MLSLSPLLFGTHYEFVRKALEHGKHVLVEKPIAASVAEAESLVEIAAKHSLTLMVNHTFIYTGAVRKMRRSCAWRPGGTVLFRFRPHQPRPDSARHQRPLGSGTP